jgi:hypothetical protein
VDGAVRWAARAPCLATDVLRLPPAQGGYGVPDIAEEVAAAQVADLMRLLNGHSIVATCLQIEFDRSGWQQRFDPPHGAAVPPAWHVQHPIEHNVPLRACGDGTFHANRPTDVVRVALVAQRSLGVRVQLARPQAGVDWDPQPGEFAAPLRALADTAVARAGVGWTGTITLCSDGGLQRDDGVGAPVLTAGVAVAFGAEAHHVDGALAAGVRFEGHGSSTFAELVGLEGALWIARRLRASAALGARLRCICDSLSAVDAVEAAQQQPQRAVRGTHRTRVARCAALGGSLNDLAIEWTPAHTGGESADALLNAKADAAAGDARGRDVEPLGTPGPRPPRLLAAATLLAPGVEAEAEVMRALRGWRGRRRAAALRAGHPNLPAAACSAVHHAALRVAWRGLRPVPAAGLTCVQRDVLRRARGGGFRTVPRAAGADGVPRCLLCAQAVADEQCWEHAVLCARSTAAAAADPAELCAAALRRAAAERARRQLRAAAEAHARWVQEFLDAAQRRRVEILRAAGAAASPDGETGRGAALRRRLKPALFAAAGAYRAAREALAAARELADEARAALGEGTQRRLYALTAVLPGARLRRGDGDLLAGLAGELSARAASYVERVGAQAAAAVPAAAPS